MSNILFLEKERGRGNFFQRGGDSCMSDYLQNAKRKGCQVGIAQISLQSLKMYSFKVTILHTEGRQKDFMINNRSQNKLE